MSRGLAWRAAIAIPLAIARGAAGSRAGPADAEALDLRDRLDAVAGRWD